MNIDEELDDLLNDPLLDLSDKEIALFDIPADMRKAEAERAQPDHYAQRKVCEDSQFFKRDLNRYIMTCAPANEA